MIELYTHPMSPCAQKVRIVLAEKRLSWTARPVDLPRKQNLEPWYLKLNKLGVVPTLVDDGLPVIESSIICEYLEDAYPAVRLRPADPHASAAMRFWMKQVDGKLHPACGTLQWPLVMRPGLLAMPESEQQRLLALIVERERRERQKRLLEHGIDAPDVVNAVRTYRQIIADMETALGAHPWIVGAQFTLADCALAPYFQTLLQFGWTALYAQCPRVADWYERVQARPSYVSGVAAEFPAPVRADLRHKGAEAWPRIARHLETA